jgi:hypothetical protein
MRNALTPVLSEGRLNTLGGGLNVDVGGHMSASFSLLGSVSVDGWTGAAGSALCCDFQSLDGALSARVGPTVRYEHHLGVSTASLQAGPRYHAQFLFFSGGLASAASSRLLHAWSFDAAISWEYPAGPVLFGVRLGATAGLEMLAFGAGFVVSLR